MATVTPFADFCFGWEKAYLAAVLETEDRLLCRRIEDAEYALALRLTVLTGSERHCGEVREIENALKGLRTLRRERLEKAC